MFFAEPENWGVIFAIRTGSATYSHRFLASECVSQEYKSKGGYLYRGGKRIAIREKEDLFKLLHIPYVEPERRNY